MCSRMNWRIPINELLNKRAASQPINTRPLMKKVFLACLLTSLVAACSSVDSSKSTATSDNQGKVENEEENAVKVAKGAARVVIMQAASTPVKIVSGVGKVAQTVKKQIEGDQEPAPDTTQ